MAASHIASEIEKLHRELEPYGAELVAVSKFHPVEALREAYSVGQRIFGESRAQELDAKIPQMPQDVRWHFIGHLQTNKVRRIVGAASLIESVDSLHLLEYIDREALRAGVVQKVLMQLHVAAEETKTGFSPQELLDYFATQGYSTLKAVHICGVMGMASNTDDSARVRSDFKEIRRVFDSIRDNAPSDFRGFDIVSMGMSSDYKIALDEGSTMVRIGTDIFGARQY